jgi:hypothetical protein
MKQDTWEMLEQRADKRYVDSLDWDGLEQFITEKPEPQVDGARWVAGGVYVLLLLAAREDL